MNLEELKKFSIFPVGDENPYGKFFDGKSYLATVSAEQIHIASVTFDAGCRNHWHIHHAKKGGGQILIATAGRGWYQEWNQDPRELLPGDVVNIPANVKHWHGAAKNSAFQHLAIEIDGEETSNEWCEPVNEVDYLNLQ